MYCPGAFTAEDAGEAGKLTVTTSCRDIYLAGKVANCPAS